MPCKPGERPSGLNPRGQRQVGTWRDHRLLSGQQPLLSNLGLNLTSYYTGFRAEKGKVDTVSSDKAQPLLSAYCVPDHDDAKEAGEPPGLQGEREGGACLSQFGPQKQMLT